MVDSIARLSAADAIQRFMACEITNEEFEERYPRSKDPALHAIHTMLWFTYDDLREHRLNGKYTLTPQARQIFEHCILFLKTDHEYTGRKSFIEVFAIFKRLWRFVLRNRDSYIPSFWPFESEEQLDAAKAK